MLDHPAYRTLKRLESKYPADELADCAITFVAGLCGRKLEMDWTYLAHAAIVRAGINQQAKDETTRYFGYMVEMYFLDKLDILASDLRQQLDDDLPGWRDAVLTALKELG